MHDSVNGSRLLLCQALLTVCEPKTHYVPCVSVEKPGEVMAVAAESCYMCVVHVGWLTFVVSLLSSFLISLFLSVSFSHPNVKIHTYNPTSNHRCWMPYIYVRCFCGWSLVGCLRWQQPVPDVLSMWNHHFKRPQSSSSPLNSTHCNNGLAGSSGSFVLQSLSSSVWTLSSNLTKMGWKKIQWVITLR